MESSVMFREMDAQQIAALLPQRDAYAHKGCFGKVLLLCGSVGFSGAAALAARAALRCGSGLITVAVPQRIYPIVAAKLEEPMVFSVADDAEGRVSERALEQLLPRLAACDACLIGPGLGQGGQVSAVVAEMLRASKVPVVLDADGINAMAGHIDVLRETACPVILTPHDGEFLRLSPLESGLPLRDDVGRAKLAAQLAKALQATVLLKGHRTIITDGNESWRNTTGNPGMATGGSGDVLSGLIVSLLGQGLPPVLAAAAGAWLHGAAGDICAAEIGQYGMSPTDMICAVPRLLK